MNNHIIYVLGIAIGGINGEQAVAWSSILAVIIAGIFLAIARIRLDLARQAKEIRDERDKINHDQDSFHEHEIKELKKTIQDSGAFRDAYNQMVIQNDALVRQNYLLSTELSELAALKEENAKLQRQVRELLMIIDEQKQEIKNLKTKES